MSGEDRYDMERHLVFCKLIYSQLRLLFLGVGSGMAFKSSDYEAEVTNLAGTSESHINQTKCANRRWQDLAMSSCMSIHTYHPTYIMRKHFWTHYSSSLNLE